MNIKYYRNYREDAPIKIRLWEKFKWQSKIKKEKFKKTCNFEMSTWDNNTSYLFVLFISTSIQK